MAIKVSVALANTQLDAITAAVGGSGLLRIYSGPQPANVATAASGTLLAELTLNATFAGAAAAGLLTLNAITQDSSADNTGTAGWFRILTSGAVAVIDGNVTATGGGGDMTLVTTSITAGGTVTITSATFTGQI